MAIPISKYISIQNNVLNTPVGDRDLSGLIFSKVTMRSDAPAAIKAKYVANEVVSLTLEEVGLCFSDATIKSVAGRYFGYTGGTRRAPVLNFALVGGSETAAAAYSRVIADFNNFGAFTFIGEFELGDKEEGGLLDVADLNNGNEYGWVFIVGTDAEGQEAASEALMGGILTHLTHAPVEALAWYASCDYSKAGAAGTIDFKQFAGATATVSTGDGKETADGLRVNYIGKVQTYGNGISFYQRGVNMDGTDLGVVRDMCWINSQIVSGYFNLQNSVQKIPANYVGCSMVRNVVVGVAVRAIENGAILIEKPLTAEQIASVNQYADDDSAADTVGTVGYFIKTNLEKRGDKYVCVYTLIYAKGDHIEKVEGLHVLV